MNTSQKGASFFLCLFLLCVGCRVELPPIEAAYSATEGAWPSEGSGGKPGTGQLSAKRVQDLYGWLVNHNDGWRYKITDNPPGRVILVKHGNGKRTTINLLGNVLWVGDRYRALTREELSSLLPLFEGP